jgi:hypothetical protein
MFAALFKLFGCSEPSKKSGLSKKEKNQMDKNIDSFMNRTKYKILTNQIIDTTSDDDLIQTVFDNLSDNVPKDYTKEYETVISWNKSRQAIFMIWWLEAEVNNGGYNQYYFNSSGQYYKLLPEALKFVGAFKFSDLTEKSNQIYEKEYGKITRHHDGTLEGFSKSYKDNPLNDQDDKFYALYKEEDLQQIQIDYIRRHKKDFIDQ